MSPRRPSLAEQRPEPRPEQRPEPRPEQRSEPRPEQRLEQRPEQRPELRPEQRSEQRPEQQLGCWTDAAEAQVATTGPPAADRPASERPKTRSVFPDRFSSAPTGSADSDLRKWTNEDLRRQIQLLERGLAVNSPSTGSAPKRSGMVLPSILSSPDAPPPSLAVVPNSTEPSAALAGASCTASETLRKEQASAGEQHGPAPSDELEVQLTMKERQVLELRAQIAKCEGQLYGGVGNTAAESPNASEPERTGPRSPTSASACGAHCLGGLGGTPQQRGTPLRSAAISASVTPSGVSGSLEGELAWVVRQMEVHRRQIQAHQQQLSALEHRHAEIISAISARAGCSPASSAAEPRNGRDYHAEPSISQHARAIAAHVREAADSSEPQIKEYDAISDAATEDMLAAAYVAPRIGASRPGSAGSTVSAGSTSQVRAKNPFSPWATSRPASASSAASLGQRSLGAGTRVSGMANLDGSGRSWASDARFQTFGNVGSGSGANTPGLERTEAASSSKASQDFLERELCDPSPHASFARRAGAILSTTNSEKDASESILSEAHEAEISRLLAEFGARRPLRVPFVPLGLPSEGEGVPYLHGALEVRLLLSEGRLLARVGPAPAGGAGGRTFEIDDFVTRAEAIEARRAYRPQSIAEEAEAVPTSPTETKMDPTRSLSSLLHQGKEPPSSLSSALPWKKLFKAHWSSAR